MSSVSASNGDDRKANLLIVLAGLGIGGAEVVVQRLVQAIDRKRFNVMVCCVKALGVIGEKMEREGLDIVALPDPNNPKVDYFTFAKLLKVIRAKKIDILHTHTTDALADAAVCKLLMPRLKLIHTFHFGNYPHIPRPLFWMERIFSKMANRLIAVGEVQRQQLRSTYGFPDRRIGRVWNGVASRRTNDGAAFRTHLNAGERIVIGTIATLIEQKGLRDFLSVAGQFRDDDNVLFVVVGEGRLRAELEALREQLGLDAKVVFCGWVENAAEVALPAFDIFFQSSLWEAMSIAILEAMASSKPIVATSVGENPYIIVDGVDGFLVEARDTRGMGTALRKLVEDPELRAAFGLAGAKKVAQQFTVEHMTRAYESIYLEELGI